MDPVEIVEQGCQCAAAGDCPHLGVRMSEQDHRICRNAVPHVRRRLITAKGAMPGATLYGPRSDHAARMNAAGVALKDKWKTCRFRGEWITEEDGTRKTRKCGTCQGKVDLFVFACEHPLIEQTDAKRCEGCSLWERKERSVPMVPAVSADAAASGP